MTDRRTAMPSFAEIQEAFASAEDPNAEPFDLRRFSAEEAMDAVPDLAALIRLWAERRGDALAPDWGDMDFADFRGWHSSICLGQFPDDEPDPLIRLMGQDFVDLALQEMKGTRFGAIYPRLYALQFREHFQAIRDHGLIGLATGKIAKIGRSHVRMRVMELPFRDGGPKVERTVHVLAPS